MRGPAGLRLCYLVVACAYLAWGAAWLVRPSAQDGVPLGPMVQVEGNTHSRIYHLPSCYWFGKLPPEKLKVFEGRTLDEAQARAEAHGYRMARNCPRQLKHHAL